MPGLTNKVDKNVLILIISNWDFWACLSKSLVMLSITLGVHFALTQLKSDERGPVTNAALAKS